MATFKIDSVNGSDTQASGNGPATAIFGTGAVSSGSGLIDVSNGSPNLSTISVGDWFWWDDSTAGKGNFAVIAVVDNILKTITVTDNLNAFDDTAAPHTWAVGGSRASLAGSQKLIENNSAAGDAPIGSIIEQQSGHVETIAATITIRRSGDNAAGKMTIQGASGAATIPILTFSNNGVAFTTANSMTGILLKDFEMRNSHVTKSASIAVSGNGTNSVIECMRLKIDNATSPFWKGIATATTTAFIIEECSIKNCVGNGVDFTGSTGTRQILLNNTITDNNTGAAGTGGLIAPVVTARGNIIARNTGDGVRLILAAASASFATASELSNNTIDANTGDAVEIVGTLTNTAAFRGLIIENNQLTNSVAGYGINMSGAGVTVAGMSGLNPKFNGNNFYGNAGASNSGKYNLDISTISQGETTVNPTYASASSNNFKINVGQAGGWPPSSRVMAYSGSTNYENQGAVDSSGQGSGGGAFIGSSDGVT